MEVWKGIGVLLAVKWDVSLKAYETPKLYVAAFKAVGARGCVKISELLRAHCIRDTDLWPQRERTLTLGASQALCKCSNEFNRVNDGEN